MSENINRIKFVLVEKKHTNCWLAEQLHKDESTVSKCYTNTVRPSLETLNDIARLLKVNTTELLVY